jgi:porphobilinogen synthase
MNFRFPQRPRRLRQNHAIRSITRESQIHATDLALPVFITEEAKPVEIPSMPGVFRWPLHELERKITEWYSAGIRAFALFPKIDESKKDSTGSHILSEDSLCYQAGRLISALQLDLCLIADLALDPYTDHGHDGIIQNEGKIVNDDTVEILAKASLLCARAGFHFVAPSDMMDGRVSVIRSCLEENGFHETGIMSYSAKFCSSYYGPFRDAIGASGGASISKQSYQLDPANFLAARRELLLDIEEGADILLIKPAEPYLDIIHEAKQLCNVPIAAYQVSGEYSRLIAASQNDWLNLQSCAMESITSIKRAGADIILTYFADRVVNWLKS